MDITICNLRYMQPKYPYDILIDRTTPVGNPFVMRGENNRKFVCMKYMDWFYDSPHTPAFHDYLEEMVRTLIKYNKLRLFCWCVPEMCHGETIRDFLTEKIKHSKTYLKGER